MSLLVPCDVSGRHHSGILSVYSRDFRISLEEDDKGHVVAFSCDQDLHNLLESHPALRTVSKLEGQECSKEQVLQLLENALTQVLDEDRSSTFQPPAFFSRLLQDLQEVGWEHVGELHPDLNQVTLEIP